MAGSRPSSPRPGGPRKQSGAANSSRRRSTSSPTAAARKSTTKTSAKRKASTGPATPKKPAQRRSLLWRFRRSLFLVGLLLIAGVAGAGFVLAQVELPPEDPLVQSTFVCAADVREACGPDNAIAKLSGEEDRVSVPLEEMPQVFIDAVLAAEDRSFFTHSGIDPIGIARALYRDLRNEGVRQGGSTITQQYAKNTFLTSERTVTRKLKEAVLAVKLERELTKSEILGRYLNAVYYGRGAYGAEAAARAYFGKSIRDVGLSESAYLASLIRAPEATDASRDPDVATFRRDSVLAGMLDENMIDQAAHDAAIGIPIGELVRDRAVRDGITMLNGAGGAGETYYVEYVRRLLYEKYGADKVNGGGLRVYVAMDPELQAIGQEAVWGFLTEPDDPAGALVSVDSQGHVVAMVGGRDFEESEVNLALGRAAGGSGRQPGSSFKPIVLAAALDADIALTSKFRNENDAVFANANAGEDWKVSNYADGEERVVDLTQATRVSSNTVYAKLMLEIGPRAVVELANDLGISAELPVVNSLVLGAGEVSVLDMATAYSTFARRGQAIEPIFITKVEQVVDGRVELLERASTKVTRVMESGDADQVNWALRQVVLGGTATAANFGVPIAGKTGTTQDYRDAWFVGYSPQLSTAVWMGFPEPDENGDPIFMRNVRGRQVTGGSFPVQIWRSFMSQALEGRDHGSFVAPTFTGTQLNPDLRDEPEECEADDYGDDGFLEDPENDCIEVDPCADVDPESVGPDHRCAPKDPCADVDPDTVDADDPCAPADPCADVDPDTVDADDPCADGSDGGGDGDSGDGDGDGGDGDGDGGSTTTTEPDGDGSTTTTEPGGDGSTTTTTEPDGDGSTTTTTEAGSGGGSSSTTAPPTSQPDDPFDIGD